MKGGFHPQQGQPNYQQPRGMKGGFQGQPGQSMHGQPKGGPMPPRQAFSQQPPQQNPQQAARQVLNSPAEWTYGQSKGGAKGIQKGGGKGGAGPKGMDMGKGGGMNPMPFGSKGGYGSDPSGAHSNVFVGNLPDGMNQSSLEQQFAPFGAIQSCYVATKSGRTYGFVKFSDVNSAQRAIQALNGKSGWLVKAANKDMSGQEGGGGKGPLPTQDPNLGVKATHTNVFVGSLMEGTTDQKLQQVFGIYGTVDSCVVMTKGDRTYGFVEFSTIPEAEKAISVMNGQSGLTVRFANNDKTPMAWDEAVPHSNLFIGNLPNGIAEREVKDACAKHGSLQSCTVKADAQTGKTFGFVKYSTVAGAKRAIKALNGHKDWIVKCANNDVLSSAKGMMKGAWPVAPSVGKGAGKMMWPSSPWAYGGWPQGFGGGKGNGKFTDKKEEEREEPDPHDNLFVKNLPPGITEEEVCAVFAKMGDVVECRVLRWDAMSDCAALVRMASVEQATRARTEVDGKVHEKCLQPISVQLQQKSGQSVADHCFVKGLHFSTTQEQLTKLFNSYGTVRWCRILAPQFSMNNSKMPDCTALVEMSSPEEAERAVNELNGTSPPGVGTAMAVRYASLNNGPERSEAKPNSNLYVKGWPVGFPDFLLQSVFQQYGTVARLRLLENPDSEQSTCAALVQMAREDEATAAMKALHRQTISPPLPPMRIRHAGKDQKPSGNLYITSLPRTITEDQLRKTFEKFGEIKRLRLLQQEKSPEMHALVELSSTELASSAIRELDNSTPVFKGPVLHVQYATKREVARGGALVGNRGAEGAGDGPPAQPANGAAVRV